jgi:hypothetical protein
MWWTYTKGSETNSLICCASTNFIIAYTTGVSVLAAFTVVVYLHQPLGSHEVLLSKKGAIPLLLMVLCMVFFILGRLISREHLNVIQAEQWGSEPARSQARGRKRRPPPIGDGQA